MAGTFCTICDKAECACGAPKYLGEIVYERQASGGWRVPDDEREQWDVMHEREHKILPVHRSRPLEQLERELDKWVFVSDKMLDHLTSAHGQNPERTTRLVEETVLGAQRGSLNNPGAYIAKMLREGVVRDIQ